MNYCICKHEHEYHVRILYYFKEYIKCEKCMEHAFRNGMFDLESFPSIHKFSNDNLKYLEYKYQQKFV